MRVAVVAAAMALIMAASPVVACLVGVQGVPAAGHDSSGCDGPAGHPGGTLCAASSSVLPGGHRIEFRAAEGTFVTPPPAPVAATGPAIRTPFGTSGERSIPTTPRLYLLQATFLI